MPRLLVILGSGETAPGMTSTHQSVAGRFDAGLHAVVLDTPYGFQANADEITRRAGNYFRDQVGIDPQPVHLAGGHTGEPADALAVERAVVALRRADWIFAGPGSPTYAVRQWAGTPVPMVLRSKLRDGGVLVFASAAACTVGAFTVPVYEIYKVGEAPFWVEGLDLLAEAGLDAVAVPHFDNAEGGTHDTRYCYLGQRRLEALEAQLPDGMWVLGVDEHTAAILDVEADTLAVAGRGGVTVRTPTDTTVVPSGTTVPLDEVRAAARQRAPEPQSGARQRAPDPRAGEPAAPSTRPGAHAPHPEVDAIAEQFRNVLAGGDAMAAAASALEVERLLTDPALRTTREHSDAGETLRSMLVELAEVAQAGLHEHRRVVAPFVDALLELRAAARERGDYALADVLRDHLVSGGVEIHDTPDATTWTYQEPR